MFVSIFRTLWGDLTTQEFKKFGLLSAALLFIIGTYWLMRPVKEAVFMRMVGMVYIPYAKMASIVFLIPLLLIYSKLVDIFEKQKLIYLISVIYGIFFICIALLIMNPTIGIANSTSCKYSILGWVLYLGVESFVTLSVTLFWSFVANCTDTASAKRGYGLICAGAQIGTICGPELAKHATQIGIPQLIFIAAFGTFMIPLMIMLFTKLHPKQTTIALQEKKTVTGFMQGIKLLITKPYLLGILGVGTLGSLIAIFLEYELLYLTQDTYHTPEKIIEFLGLFGQTTNFLTLIITLIGTSFIIRKIGVTFSLIAYPICVGIVVCLARLFPILSVLFASMVAIKCLGYSLNSPCKEILYIPTSEDIKFKAKGWIDAFGDRAAKGIGGGITALFPVFANLVFYGSIISLGIIAFWISIAWYVGTTNSKLVQENKIIE